MSQEIHIDLTGAWPEDLSLVHRCDLGVHLSQTAQGRTSVLISFTDGTGRRAIEVTGRNLMSIAGAVRGHMIQRGEISVALNPGIAMTADALAGTVQFVSEAPLKEWDYTAPHALAWARIVGMYARRARGVEELVPSLRDVQEIERVISDPRENHFSAWLFRLIKKADFENRERLRDVYPLHVEALVRWEQSPHPSQPGEGAQP
jgi:hypothetical protein